MSGAAATQFLISRFLPWLSFLTFTPPLDNAEFRRIDNERVPPREASRHELGTEADQSISCDQRPLTDLIRQTRA